MLIIYFLCLVVVQGGQVPKENLKDEHCTDPRTMRKHAAYTEWADAYSCTRHRCQPGGRNLAIYTVGCKRVEAPESAIECEEVVEDTNMQFPYCCTRLRCLVVVRGEVWTRVLGQPWETLPAAPWSHMYKMKKPPPDDTSFLPKNGPSAGPVYELAEEKPTDRRTNDKDCDKPAAVARAQPAPAPDIVIALTTNEKKSNNPESPNSKFLARGVDGDRSDQPNDIEAEETPPATEKVPEIISEERMFAPEKKISTDNNFPEPISEDELPNYRGLKDSRMHNNAPDALSDEQYNSNKRPKKPKMPDAVSDERMYSNVQKKTNRSPKSWARIPQSQWNSNPSPRTHRMPENPSDYEKDRDSGSKVDPPLPIFHGDSEEKQEEKPASLQHLVNAIGTRMRDIENVVQQMSEKVQPPMESAERIGRSVPHPKTNPVDRAPEIEPLQPKKPYIGNYNRSKPIKVLWSDITGRSRFAPHESASKYLRSGGGDATTEPPLFVGDNQNGYFSDPSNNLLRRTMNNNAPKEPHTYMVPVITEHKKTTASDFNPEPEPEIKHKKHTHKKKKSKRGRKKHHREEREKMKFTESPPEFEKNVVSLEDSNDFDLGSCNALMT